MSVEHAGLRQLIMLARKGTDEAWEEVDKILPELCDDAAVVQWARVNIHNDNLDLSDLAATILEATNIELNKDDTSELLKLMSSNKPENPYPSFRAACALAKRFGTGLIPDDMQAKVKSKLKEFLDDEDVAGIAQEYLSLLSRPQF